MMQLGRPDHPQQRQAVKSATRWASSDVRACRIWCAVLTCEHFHRSSLSSHRDPATPGRPPQVRHRHARSAQDRPRGIFRSYRSAARDPGDSLKSSPHRHRASACASTLRRSAVSLAKVARQLNAALIWINSCGQTRTSRPTCGISVPIFHPLPVRGIHARQALSRGGRARRGGRPAA